MNPADTSIEIYTLITGASMGIGRSFAFECARRGLNVLLVALPEPELEETAEGIRKKYNVRVVTLGIDLSAEDSPLKVFNFTRENGIRVNILINNAGFGYGGFFTNVSFDVYQKMIRLNNMAMVGLIYYFIEDLKTFPVSHILNMSSMEANLPLPYKTIYTGTKNFIYAFSLALNEELRENNIKITIVCPGPVVTNEAGLKRLQAQGMKGKLLAKMPDEIARISISGMLKGKKVIIPGTVPWIVSKIAKCLPEGFKMRLLERLFRVNRQIPFKPTNS